MTSGSSKTPIDVGETEEHAGHSGGHGDHKKVSADHKKPSAPATTNGKPPAKEAKAEKKPKRYKPRKGKGAYSRAEALKGIETTSLPKRSVGRPTTYRAKYCEEVLVYAAEGMGPAEIAAHVGVPRDTMYGWARRQPEFARALARAYDLSLAWWYLQGRLGVWAGKSFNAQAYNLQMLNRFAEDWRDQREVKITGVLAGLDMSRLTDEQVSRIAGGEHPLAVLASTGSIGMLTGGDVLEAVAEEVLAEDPEDEEPE